MTNVCEMHKYSISVMKAGGKIDGEESLSAFFFKSKTSINY